MVHNANDKASHVSLSRLTFKALFISYSNKNVYYHFRLGRVYNVVMNKIVNIVTQFVHTNSTQKCALCI